MAKSVHLRVKRIYEPPSPQDGLRFLVDRLWPRGLKRESCELDGWLKEVAPSDKLRRWLGHDPARWDWYKRRYFNELDARQDDCEAIAEQAWKKTVTLLYGARGPEHNDALALKTYLQRNQSKEKR